MNASFQIAFSFTVFFIFPSVPSWCQSCARYAMNTPISTIPSALLSCPSIASTNGSIRAIHIMNLLLVKIVDSRAIFLPSTVTMPSAKAACTMFAPMIAPYPTPVSPPMNPITELMTSGALAAIATTTSPMMASERPSFLA